MFKRRKPEAPQGAAPGESVPEGQSPSGPDAARSVRSFGTYQGSDNGLGVPPFRPAAPKEAQAMNTRPPFPTAPGAPHAPAPGGVRPAVAPPVRGREPSERRTLVVGRGISVQGSVQDAERLVVEGTVESSSISATELSIAPGGVFKGEIEVEEAEVGGTIDGTLTARGSLTVRATGRVLGTARCRRLQVEDGGQITGRIEMLTSDAPAKTEPTRLPSSISTPAPIEPVN